MKVKVTNQAPKLQPTKPTNNPRAAAGQQAVLPTFLDHIYELRRRLFWVVGFVVLASSAAFPFYQQIIDGLTLPLGGGQNLYYLTPIGGFSFIVKICLYVGILCGIPLIIYHLYRYLEPLMPHSKKPVLLYVGMSSLLAVAGIMFAYFVSLPAALHFLTGFNIDNVQAMLTVDSYLSFVMTYMLAAALLFQIPLVLLIINGIRPTPPRTLMKLQRYVILGSFIIAAVISPTPDLVNQALLAGPIIAMYQIGVVLVCLKQRYQKRGQESVVQNTPQLNVPDDLFVQDTPQSSTQALPQRQVLPSPRPVQPHNRLLRQPSVAAPVVDGFRVREAAQMLSPSPLAPTRVQSRSLPARSVVQHRPLRVPIRSVDGMSVSRAQAPVQ